MSSFKVEQLRQAAGGFGVDLVGIAPIERFSSLPADQNPASIFPECKSVIVIGKRIPRGTIRGIEEGTNFNSTYMMFGYHWLEDNFLSQMTYDLVCWIESQSVEAVPMFGYNPEGMPKGAQVSPDKPAPNVIVNPYFAAQAAGLGQMGKGGFFLTPEYGTRQRFAMILVDIELEYNDLVEVDFCGDCNACATACPLEAIDFADASEFGPEGNSSQLATVDNELCSKCPNGAMLVPGRGTKFDRVAAACGRACLNALDVGDKCQQKFVNKFRKRKPWALDIFEKPIKDSE